MTSVQNCKEFLVNYNDDVYDIGKFIRFHPGGINTLQGFKNKSIKKKFDETEHSKAAKYIFKEYKLHERSKHHKKLENDDSQDFEDLENLVDWSKPMLPQLGNLGSKYIKWVESPVDRKLILFKSTFLENLTVTPWYVVPMFWIPIILYLAQIGLEKYRTPYHELDVYRFTISVLFYLIAGFGLWTLIEYSLHRWVFHMAPSGKSKAFITFHFLLHGLHHKVPFDSGRLVFPPFPAALITLAGFYLYKSIFPDHLYMLIGAGSLSGYLIYDMTHFYLHHGSPSDGSYLYNLKRVHNQHHFAHQTNGFGVSSRFWDGIFGTGITLKKLNTILKW